MTPIFTVASWAIAGRAKPAAKVAAPTNVVRRVVLIMRESPRKNYFSARTKDWHEPMPSANPVSLDRRRIELDAEPRPFGQQRVTGIECERLLQELGAQRVVAHV